ncbi:hypothetical protein M426DRAFT_203975 [Hypoxylon sp. CI-4A]|nr:hypothetical protein M426DRAFT_203975 [Hypoxylon sp. CI-4A]
MQHPCNYQRYCATTLYLDVTYKLPPQPFTSCLYSITYVFLSRLSNIILWLYLLGQSTILPIACPISYAIYSSPPYLVTSVEHLEHPEHPERQSSYWCIMF